MTYKEKFPEAFKELSRMKTLDQIMIECESDKASIFTRTYAKPHNYCVHLERFFEPLRDKPIKLLEIGVGGGESIRAWLEYFSQGRIFGVDMVANTNEWNTPAISSSAIPHERYTFSHGDQSDPKFWNKFIEVHGGDWDVVIDDGSHKSDDIKTTFWGLWTYLKSGGIYEVEDLNSAPDAKNFLIGLARTISQETSPIDGTTFLDSIYFSKELAILRKK